MRIRLALVAAAIAAAAGVLIASSVAVATPRHSITINAQPNPDVVGDPVLIFGRLSGPNVNDKRVVLWHRLAGHSGFTRVASVRTDALGFYEIPRVEGLVTTNRFWFVTSDGARSRTVKESVFADVTANGPSTALTNEPVSITGKVTPNHAGERIYLQRQVGANTDDWRTIDSARIRAGSTYTIVHRFRVADTYTLRTLFGGDRRNLRSPSSSFELVVNQRQNPKLTIAASADPIDVGQSVNVTGHLAGVSAPEPVTLYARPYNGSFSPVATALTNASGDYSFTQTPQTNTVYKVQAVGKSSAQLFEAVRVVLSIQASATTLQTGQTLTLSGTVTPPKPGHSIELQILGDDGDFHTLQFGTVSGSTYQINHVVQSPGQKTYRVLLNGGPINAGGHSPTVTVTVTPPPPSA